MADIDKIYCIQCGEKLNIGVRNPNSIRSTSPRYENNCYALPICKKCAKIQFEVYLQRYSRLRDLAQKKLALFRFCESYDLPYMSKILPKTNSEEFLMDYLRGLWGIVNVNKRSYTFDDSDIKSEKQLLTKDQIKVYFGIKKEVESTAKDEKEAKVSLRKKWGTNPSWTAEDYEMLETKYNEWLPKDVELDPQIKNAIESACIYWLLERQRQMEGDISAAKTARDALDKVLASAMMRTSDKKEHKEPRLQDIVSLCDSEKMIEPWDDIVKYDHTMDIVEQVTLILLNDQRKLVGADPYSSLRQAGYELNDNLGQCRKEPSEWEKDVKEKLSIYSENDEYISERGDKD